MGGSSDSGFGGITQNQLMQQQLAQQQVAQQQDLSGMSPQQAAFANQGGGLMAGGIGQPLQFVRPSNAFQQGSANNAGSESTSARNAQAPVATDPYTGQPIPAQPQQTDNGQGFVNGPTAQDGSNPLPALTPEQAALYALQSKSGQTAGGLMVGPNHTLVQAPQPQLKPIAPIVGGQQAPAPQIAPEVYSGGGGNGPM